MLERVGSEFYFATFFKITFMKIESNIFFDVIASVLKSLVFCFLSCT